MSRLIYVVLKLIMKTRLFIKKSGMKSVVIRIRFLRS